MKKVVLALSAASLLAFFELGYCVGSDGSGTVNSDDDYESIEGYGDSGSRLEEKGDKKSKKKKDSSRDREESSSSEEEE
ncbi:MAG: hypothetical protein LBD81_02070 [Holosporaceae bacterium]|nr:hypothetical protein [Holosporaceae bacterium]